MKFRNRVVELILLILLLAPFTEAVSQADDASDAALAAISDLPEYGFIPDSLLRSDITQNYPDAPYLVLLKGLRVTFENTDRGILALLHHHERIKIASKEGLPASVVSVPYYSDKNMESVTGIRGRTFHPDGSFTDLDTSDVRNLNLNSRYDLKEFSLPDVEPGAVLEYQYTIERRFIEELPRFTLSSRVPTQQVIVELINPDYLRYRVEPQNLPRELHYTKSVIDTSSVPKVFTFDRPEPLLKETWKISQLKPIQSSPISERYNEQAAHLNFQLTAFGKPRQPLELSWEYIVAKMRRELNPWDNIDAFPQLDSIGREVAKVIDDPVALQDSIYFLVNQRAAYNEGLGTFTGNRLDSVMAGELSPKSAINQALIGVLRGAGIEANPLLLSARNYGDINKEFPSIFQFNTLLVHTVINGQSYFLDASYPMGSVGLLDTESFNRTGLVFQRQGFTWVDLEPTQSKFSTKVALAATLQPDGTLVGRMETIAEGYAAREIRKLLARGFEKGEVLRSTFLDIYPEVATRNVTITIAEDRTEVTLAGDVRIVQYATSYRSGLEYRPLVTGYLLSNPIDQSAETASVQLDAPEQLSLHFEITIPEALTLKSEQSNSKTSFEGAYFEEYYRAEEQTLRYGFEIDITKREFTPERIPQLYDLYEKWVDVSNLKWFLTKSDS